MRMARSDHFDSWCWCPFRYRVCNLLDRCIHAARNNLGCARNVPNTLKVDVRLNALHSVAAEMLQIEISLILLEKWLVHNLLLYSYGIHRASIWASTHATWEELRLKVDENVHTSSVLCSFHSSFQRLQPLLLTCCTGSRCRGDT